MKKHIQLHQTQKFAIAIPVLFVSSCATKHWVERFRFSVEFRWIYEYVGVSALLLSFFLVVFSFTNSILVLRDLKSKGFQKALWFLLSSSVFLLFAGLMVAIALNVV
ncbi:hypothetical protein AAEO57_03680 [Flavobacterium sp. DGU38]|uniref:Lipoprotein n=1 Tax=Flavobacterium calami TaxID=3139144 RepID=A0ABU9ILU8_9FLAO